MMPIRQTLAVFFLCAATTIALAAAPPGPALSQPQRSELLQTLSAKLRANYIFPEVVARIDAALPAKAQAYPADVSAREFAELLSKDLRALGDDKHFRVFHDPRFKEDSTPNAVPSAQEMAQQRSEIAGLGFGIEKLQRLPGNVAYLELRGFGPPELVSAAYGAAISLLDGSEALILDLRRNGGGAPASVAQWMSHFFPLGDQRHLNDIYTRSTDKTQQYWTLPSVAQRYAKPVYVLTSARTFSAGEECAYDFQTQKRAVLVGQTTGGGANAGDRFSLGHGMVVNIPTARAVNPVTQGNWEHVGVKPDIEVAPAQAQQTAYVAILRLLSTQAQDPEQAARLRRLLALAEKGESEPPSYELRQ